MDSPIFPVIANIFMKHFEKETLRKIPEKLEIWFRLNDTFIIWRHGRATELFFYIRD